MKNALSANPTLFCAEGLESRVLLSADPGSTLKTALNLGTLAAPQIISESLSPTDRADYYAVRVTSKGNFNATLSGMTNNADLALLDRRGNVLVSAAHKGAANERISKLLGNGTFYVRVTARRNISTNYTLQLQADANYGTVELAGSKETVSLVFANGSTAPINPKADTWIVIHGWEGSPSMYRGLSSALQSKRTQVLALDWSGPASSDLLTAFAWASPVGQFAADTLTRWGLPTSRINVVGHSLGGLVAGALAANVDGGVNRVVALDPATDPFAWTVDYSADSQFSLAFIGSSFSTSAAAATADESFKIDVGDFTSIFSHMAVVDLFTSIVTSNKTATPDPISRLLAFDRLTPTADQPWKTDAYSDDFEGTIVGRQSHNTWSPATLKYVSATSGKTVTVKA